MPKFTFAIRRTYTITEGFDRIYDAETPEQAQAMADAECAEYDMDCPDDCAEDERGFTESSNFGADLVSGPKENTP